MHKVLILGAGKIGALISGLLAESGDYEVTLGDVDAAAAEAVVKAHGCQHLRAVALDAGDAKALENHFHVHKPHAVISSLPYYCNPAVAKAARKGNAHYFDLTEDVEVTRAVRAHRAWCNDAPSCPNVDSPRASSASRPTSSSSTSTSCARIKLRVGALPQHPNNVLKYSLTWSTEGLINEYGNPCQSVVDGKVVDAAPLEGLEEIEIDGTLVRGVQHVGRPGFAGRDLRQAVRADQLQDHALSGALRADAPAHERSEAEFGSRHAQARAGARRAADPAGRGHRVCRGGRQTGRRTARRKLRQQDLSADDRGPIVVGHPGDHGRRHHRGRGSGAVEPPQISRVRCPGTIRVAGNPREPIRPVLRARRHQGRFLRRSWSRARRDTSVARR